jgi:hypothetical protein
MIETTVKLDLSEFKRAGKRLSYAAKDLRPVWRRTHRVWKEDIREQVKRRTGPEGKFPPLAGATQEKRRKQRASPRGKKWKRKMARGLLGKLRFPIVVSYARQRMRAISKIDWSVAHQYGLVVGRGVRLPQRTHVYASGHFLDHVHNLIRRRLKRAWYQGAA